MFFSRSIAMMLAAFFKHLFGRLSFLFRPVAAAAEQEGAYLSLMPQMKIRSLKVRIV